MSFTIIEQATPRLHRSELAVPGSNPGLFEKAAQSAADIIFLDVEDAVAPDDKEQARKNIIAALNDINWGTKTMMVRINGLDTHYMYRDVVDIVEACPRLDMILIPKAGVPADVYAVDMLVTQIEAAKKRDKRIGFEVLIETALGMANLQSTTLNLSIPLDPPSVQILFRRGHQGAPHRQRDGRCRQGWKRRGVARRPSHRHRQHQDGGSAFEKSSGDGRRGLRGLNSSGKITDIRNLAGLDALHPKELSLY